MKFNLLDVEVLSETFTNKELKVTMGRALSIAERTRKTVI